MGRPTYEKTAALAVFTAASCLLVAHVRALNDWSEMRADHGDSRALSRRDMSALWICLLVASLLLLIPFGLRTLAIALAIAVLSAVYSAPPYRAKGIPVLNSAIHLTGGVLHFLLGYSLFRVIDLRGLEIAFFFALTFVAGHLTQEVRDHDWDLHRGARRLHGGRPPAGPAGRPRHRPARARARCRPLPPSSLLVAERASCGPHIEEHASSPTALPHAVRRDRRPDGRSADAPAVTRRSLLAAP